MTRLCIGKVAAMQFKSDLEISFINQSHRRGGYFYYIHRVNTALTWQRGVCDG
jgi:hypothetical protein